MRSDPDFSAAAALLAEPARAAILARLLDGRSWTATELAKAAGVVPSTGSQHLARLLDQGWVRVHVQGRYRYYSLANEEIATFLEGFSAISPVPLTRTPGERRAVETMRHCRMCYDHVAGCVGVALTGQLLSRGWLTSNFHLTGDGATGLAALGLRVPEGPGRGCMDWSERRLHLAGPAGRALAVSLLEARWLQRDPHSRALWVAPQATESLEQLMGKGNTRDAILDP